jgi:hypothetical protein
MVRHLPLMILSVFRLALLAEAGASQEAPSFATLEGVDSFTATYYQRPRPDLIPDLFRALQPTGVSERPNAVPPFVGFFSEVFAANPGRLAEWEALVPKQEASTRRLLYQGLALSRAGGVLTIEGHSPALNDMYWGAFGASGRTAFLQKLVDQLRYWDERDDQLLFFAGATAKWSLASNAQSDSLVRSTLAGQTLKADQRTRALITELLTQPPAQVKQDIADIVRDQRAAGKWRTVAPTRSVPTDKRGGDSLWVSKHKSEIDTLQLLSQERASRQPDTTS